jgi:hypothetical protein
VKYHDVSRVSSIAERIESPCRIDSLIRFEVVGWSLRTVGVTAVRITWWIVTRLSLYQHAVLVSGVPYRPAACCPGGLCFRSG